MHKQEGIIYGGGDNLVKFIGFQVLGPIVILLWCATVSLFYFMIAKKLNMLRADVITEIVGLDFEGEIETRGLALAEIRRGLKGYYHIGDDELVAVREPRP